MSLTPYTSTELESLPDRYDVSASPGVPFWVRGWELAGDFLRLLAPGSAVPEEWLPHGTFDTVNTYYRRLEAIAPMAGEEPPPREWQPVAQDFRPGAADRLASQLADLRVEQRVQADLASRRADLAARQRDGGMAIGAMLLGAIGLRSGRG